MERYTFIKSLQKVKGFRGLNSGGAQESMYQHYNWDRNERIWWPRDVPIHSNSLCQRKSDLQELFNFNFFTWQNIHDIKFITLTILSAYFNSIKYIHIVVQLSPLSISRTS